MTDDNDSLKFKEEIEESYEYYKSKKKINEELSDDLKSLNDNIENLAKSHENLKNKHMATSVLVKNTNDVVKIIPEEDSNENKKKNRYFENVKVEKLGDSDLKDINQQKLIAFSKRFPNSALLKITNPINNKSIVVENLNHIEINHHTVLLTQKSFKSLVHTSDINEFQVDIEIIN